MSPTSRPCLLAALALLAVAGPAQAVDLTTVPSPAVPLRPGDPEFMQASRPGGFYIGTLSGANFVERTRSRFDTYPRGMWTRTDYEVAAYSAGRAGYAFDPLFGSLHTRVEAEVGYASNSVDRQRVGAAAPTRSDAIGEVRALQAYGNAYVELPLANGVKPYLGGGVGVADVSYRKVGTIQTGILFDTSAAGFAYHLDAGIGFDLSRFSRSQLLSGTTLEVGYRWTQAPDLRVTARDGTVNKIDYQSNTVTVGTRKSF